MQFLCTRAAIEHILVVNTTAACRQTTYRRIARELTLSSLPRKKRDRALSTATRSGFLGGASRSTAGSAVIHINLGAAYGLIDVLDEFY